MATLKQVQANRLNAQKSTGPRSAEGKAHSSANALQSGIYAESEVLPWEDPAERESLTVEYHQHHQPRTPEERALIDNLVHGEFLARRFRKSEVKIVLSKIPAGANPREDGVAGQAYIDASSELGRLQRRMDANNRAFHRDLDQLRLLKAERPPFDPPPPLVLVPLPQDPPDPSPVGEPDSPEPEAPAAHPEAPAPHPEPPLSTAQPTETTPQTSEMGSFRQSPPDPLIFNPKNPKHPPTKECSLCRQIGRIHDACPFQPIRY